MHQKTLEKLGLSPNEAKIYETLVEKGESSVSDIAISAKIHRRNAYDAIKRLIDKGLCFEIFSSKENLYNAVDPGKLLELVSEQKEEVENMLPALFAKFGQRVAPEEAFMFRGYEGQKNIWREILRVGEDIRIIGAKAQWFDPKLDAPRDAFYRETKRKKMKFHLLLDDEVRTVIPNFIETYPGFVEARYLPKESSTSAIVVLFGDYVVMYSGVGIKKMNDRTTFFVIRSKDLAEGYRAWFQNIWNKASGKK